MNPKIKLILSFLFVAAVAFFVGRGCSQRAVPPFQAPSVPKAAKPALPAARAKMAVILDDWGHRTSTLALAIDIRRPLTLAVLPHLAHSADVARRAKKAGLGVMLHMPMEPQSKTQPMEPETIRVEDSEEEILDHLRRALASVPGVEGVNNHQGSAATMDPRVMRTVLGEIKKKGLFFVDSQVIAGSVGAGTAETLGVPHARRDVFLDNTSTVEAVKEQLRKAAAIALKTGSVVCIGHDKRSTLQAIAEMVPELEAQGIKFVSIKELLTG